MYNVGLGYEDTFIRLIGHMLLIEAFGYGGYDILERIPIYNDICF